MAKPTEVGAWALGPGTILEPSHDFKVRGWLEGDKPPARWHNWLFNTAYQWQQYLDNLHNESEFLNKLYAWTGLQRFHDGVRVCGTSNEILYGDGAGDVAARTRTIALPLTSFAAANEEGGTYDEVWRWSGEPLTARGIGWYRTSANTGVFTNYGLHGQFYLPSGARLLSARAGVRCVSSAPISMVIGNMRVDESDPTNIIMEPLADATTTSSGILTATVAAPVDLDGATSTTFVNFLSEEPDTMVKWVKLVFLDPGPRNF